MWAGFRHYVGKATTVLAQMTATNLEPVITLPSGGDTSYPGFLWHDSMLWMTYYSSHEGKTDIYLAKFGGLAPEPRDDSYFLEWLCQKKSMPQRLAG